MSHRHLRVAPWQGDPQTALVGPARSRRGPFAADIVRCLQNLQRRGVTTAVTPALSTYEAEPFYQAGFTLHERLHLLAKDLTGRRQITTDDESNGSIAIHNGDGSAAPDPPSSLTLSTARRWHRSKMLSVDTRAFQGFWQFDAVSLSEALNATPQYWARLAQLDGEIIGYAVTGRAGDRGYLQRLAVVPEAQGQGVGSTLVNDATAWLRKRGVTAALVNTQETNTRALDLYLRLGFVRQAEGLIVLRWDT